MNAISTGRKLTASGVDLSQFTNQFPHLFPGGMATGALPTADQSNQLLQNQNQAAAQGTATGTGLGNAPFVAQEQTNKLALQRSENDFKNSLADKEIGSKENIAKLERDTQTTIHQAANATQLKIAGLDPDYKPSSGVIHSMQVAFATGQAKPNLNNPVQRAAFESNQQLGMRDFDPKEAEALKQGQNLIPLFDKLREFAKQLPTSQTGAFTQGKGLALQNWAGWPSDTQNKLNIINSQAIQVGKGVEGLTGGRLSNTQLELDLHALGSGGITRGQAEERLNNLQDLYTNKQEGQLFGGMRDAQKDLIRNQYGIKKLKPQWLNLAPKKNSAGHVLDEENSIKLGQPVYSQQQ